MARDERDTWVQAGKAVSPVITRLAAIVRVRGSEPQQDRADRAAAPGRTTVDGDHLEGRQTRSR